MSLFIVLLLGSIITISAQNPKMVDIYSSYSSGKLVGIDYSNELRVMDISFSILKTICEDYSYNLGNSNYRTFGALQQQVTSLKRENEQLEKQVEELKRQLDELENLVDRLEDKIN